jgi:Spy/CpxP family protein refolding chaperone
MTRPRLVAALLLVLALLVGVVVGIALDRTVLLRGPFGGKGWRMAFTGPSPAFRERMLRELGLTPEQRVRVDSVIDRSHREFCAVHDDIRPRLDSVVARTRRGIDSVLTPEQRVKAEKLKARVLKFKHKRGMPGRPGFLGPDCPGATPGRALGE